MLHGYFDESGIHREDGSTVIAGYIADEQEWALVEGKWRQIIGNYGIGSFHMTDAIAQRGEFLLKERYLIVDMCNALARILSQSNLQPIWCGVQASIWTTATNEAFRKIFPKPYDLCFLEVLRQVRAWQRETRRYGAVQLTFGQQNEYEQRNAQRSAEWARLIKRSPWPISYQSPLGYPALQAADMLSHELYLTLNNASFDEKSCGQVSTTSMLDQASRLNLGFGGFITEQALKLRVANRDWDETLNWFTNARPNRTRSS